MENNSDLIIVDDEEPGPAPAASPWRVMVVDDDEDVHGATDFAIRGAVVLGRPVETLHAHSVDEALAVAEASPEIAVALIDVVMETPDAGLRLVQALREAGWREMRIVLRTGYPGYAPEMSVITDYEIDDYRTKEELTRTRLLSVLTATIRGYDQISAIGRGRAGLEMIIESSTQLFQRTNLEIFSQGVLVQVGALLRVEPDGFVCVRGLERPGQDTSCIVSAIGEFAPLIGKPLSVVPEEIIGLLQVARGQIEPVFKDNYMVMQFTSDTGRELSAVLKAHATLEVADLGLLRLFCTNISIGFENLALVEELDRLAFSDAVLGIPNLNAFELELGKTIEADRSGKRIVLLAVDSFQSIVAAYGTHIANRLLIEINARLTDRAKGATVAVVAEATFGVIAGRDVVGTDFVEELFAEPFRIDAVELAPPATSAIVELDDLPDDAANAMRIATTALLHVKQARAGESVVYGAAMQREVERKRLLQVALKEIVGTGEGLEVSLQPQIDLLSGAVVGAEALLRWTRDGEAVSPAEFIPIAEVSGLTQGLTEFVFETVAAWSSSQADDFPVAVNLSMADLNRPGFAHWVMDRLRALELTPNRIKFEVTEGIAMREAPHAVRQVYRLTEAGYRIALDDFGTGYSSLGHFSRLPIDTVKIDRSFVKQLEIANARRSLASIVLTMTNTFNVDCIAEGIETEEQKQALLFLGCRIGQGYLLGRPTPIGLFNETFERGLAN